MLPFGVFLVSYIACGGLLWFVAHLLAPVGYEISLGRGILTVFVITMFAALVSMFLKPMVGHWHVLVDLVGHVLIVRSFLRLSWGSSLTAVIIYWVALMAAVFFLIANLAAR
jgi:hypothetical protein